MPRQRSGPNLDKKCVRFLDPGPLHEKNNFFVVKLIKKGLNRGGKNLIALFC